MPVNRLITAALLTLLAAPAHAADWYQVDIIVFKPRVVNLDEESWPVFEPVYPANVLSVHEAGVFRLSQLEQAELQDPLQELAPLESDDGPRLSSSDFVFQSASRSNRNRRVIETVSSTGTEEPVEGETAEIGETIMPSPVDIETIIREALAASEPDSPGKLAFRRVDDASSLRRVLGSLTRSSRFDVLTHQSWIQPLDETPSPVMIQAGQRFDDRFEVEGTLSFTRSRYLHVATDLWYTVFEPRDGTADPFRQEFSSSLPDALLEEHADLVEVEEMRGRYVPARMHLMEQSRRMRSDELHYIDHPLFGVIVRINPV